MASFTDDDSCIFGTALVGDRNKAIEGFEQTKIFGFICKIERCDLLCKNFMLKYFSDFDLHYNIGDALNGKRGIIEPGNAYIGMGLRSKKSVKPKKSRKHNLPFRAESTPAICFYDNIVAREKRIKLAKIKLT